MVVAAAVAGLVVAAVGADGGHAVGAVEVAPLAVVPVDGAGYVEGRLEEPLEPRRHRHCGRSHGCRCSPPPPLSSLVLLM